MWVDLLRLVPIVGALLLVGLIAAVLRSYWRAARRPGAAGLLPKHVLLVSLSFLLFVGSATVEMVHYMADPMTWRLPVHTAGVALGVLAMVEIVRFERRRIHTSVTRVVIEETTTQTDDEGDQA